MFFEQNREKKIQELILENERLSKEMTLLFSSFEPIETQLSAEKLGVIETFKKQIDERLTFLNAEKKVKTRPQSHWLFVK